MDRFGEFRVATHAVAVASDVNDVAPVEQAVEQCGGHDLVAEDATPLLEALVGGEHSRGVPVAPVDELEEQDRAALGHRQVADLVHDEQRRVGQRLESAVEPARGFGLLQGVHQVGQRAEVDLASALGSSDRQVRLSHAGRAEEDDVLLALQKAQFVERVDLLALDRGLEGEVEAPERLHVWQAAGAHGGLEATAVAKRDLSGQELLDRLGRSRLPPVDPGQHAVERLQGAGHLQVGELGRDPFPA